MVGHDRDDRPVVKRASSQLDQQFAHCRIYVCDLAVIGRSGILGLVGFGRIVGMMRIVKMHPHEERPCRRLPFLALIFILVQPCQSVRDHVMRPALSGLVPITSRTPIRKAGVISVESAAEALSKRLCRVERKRTTECRRTISAGM